MEPLIRFIPEERKGVLKAQRKLDDLDKYNDKMRINDVANFFNVTRQTVHSWIRNKRVSFMPEKPTYFLKSTIRDLYLEHFQWGERLPKDIKYKKLKPYKSNSLKINSLENLVNLFIDIAEG
jgi:uncharacterized protein YjcR